MFLYVPFEGVSKLFTVLCRGTISVVIKSRGQFYEGCLRCKNPQYSLALWFIITRFVL